MMTYVWNVFIESMAVSTKPKTR